MGRAVGPTATLNLKALIFIAIVLNIPWIGSIRNRDRGRDLWGAILSTGYGTNWIEKAARIGKDDF